MSGPTLVIELAEPLSPAALREFRALVVGLSSHFDEKWPGFFEVNVPAERLGVGNRREEDWRKPFPLPFLGNATSDNASPAAALGSPSATLRSRQCNAAPPRRRPSRASCIRR
ncbi:DUF6368 family protein [Streptomyces sp. NPDC006285]|uniref:DUF6368 family protein n=1 Tax=Streptomyces sp. NPDC006285 TaxID=3364742 RepID=UPI003687B8DC